MKQLLLGFGMATLAVTAVSCGHGSAAKHEEKVMGDSVSYTYGQQNGNQLNEMVNRQMAMNGGEGPELNIDKFMKGMALVLDADTTDNLSMISGISYALQRIYNLKMTMAQDTVPFNTGLFIKGFKEAYNDTTATSYRSGYSEWQMRLNKLHQDKESARLAQEVKANGEAGEQYIDSVKAADSSVQVSESGLVYKIIEPGNENKVPENAKIKLNYKGMTVDGKVFDETNGTPREMRMGQFIPGFNEGLAMLGEGGKAVLYIPGNLAYGDMGQPRAGIGPNSTLVFEIELVEIVPVEEPAKK